MKNKGQSLFEVLVALTISVLVIVTLVSLVNTSTRNATFSKNKTLASRYAQEATEWLRGQRDNDIVNFKTRALTATWCLRDLGWTISGTCSASNQITGTVFTRQLAFSSSVISGKTLIQADVSVTWTDAQGAHEVRSSTNFSDWRER